ncbi:hypothetical protein [Fluviibacterium sp. S390]|uniref:hypothetical protein n=1 Tax=Fluviibacterium sp. S390 TaxID=3415139 RepID=UPI003C7E8CB5
MTNQEKILGGGWHDAGEIVVASDANAKRSQSWVKRSESGTVLLLTTRNGPSGQVLTVREVRENPLGWKYLGEGESFEELSSSLLTGNPMMKFSDTIEDSIADVCTKHAIASIREVEGKGK